MSCPSFPVSLIPSSSAAVALSTMVWVALSPLPTLAQSVIPAAGDAQTQVTPNGSVYDITGGTLSGDGANLFHSFQQFGLTPAEVANFIANPAVQNILGRVTGGNVSVIDGLLQVTGSDASLYLINPAGILFGPNAALNLGGSFTAASASGVGFGENWLQAIGDADYARLNGDPTGLAFGEKAAALINAGNLAVNSGETLALVGGAVINTGTLTAPGGQIVVMAIPGENLVSITPEGARLSLELATLPDTAIVDTGSRLNPLDIPSLLRAGGPAVATGITVNEGGTVSLVGSEQSLPTSAGTAIASGDISTTGLTGGTVYILGELVGITDAVIDASGPAGGGTLLVGGDYQGQGSVPNARRTLIDLNSTLVADALENGDGGTVIAWADEVTQFLGTITARGGANAGNGGLVEVSGKETLDFRGDVDVGAPHGDLGTLLLDPDSIVIQSTDSSSTGVVDALPDIFAGDFSGLSIIINGADLETQIGNIVLEATGDIFMGFDTDPDLNFEAGGSITFTADSDRDGFGNFTMAPGSSITTAGPRDVTISGEFVTLGAIDASGGDITLVGNSLELAGGTDSIRTTGNLLIGTADIDRDIDLGTLEDLGTGLDLTTTELDALADGFNSITISTLSGNGQIRLDGSATFSDPITLATSGFIDAFGRGSLSGTDNATITLEGISGVLAGDITTAGTAVKITADSAAGDAPAVWVISPIATSGGDITLAGFNGELLASGVAVEGDLNSGGGNITITGTGGGSGADITIASPIDSGGGDILLTGETIATQTGEGEGGTIDSGSGNISFVTDNPELGIEIPTPSLPISGIGFLQFQPLTPSLSLELGGTSTYLDSTELAQIADGFSTITFGGGDFNGTILLAGDVTFSGSPIVNLETGGSIDTTGGTLASAGTTALILVADKDIATGPITTEGQTVSIIGDADGNGDGAVNIFGDLSTSGGLISASGASNSAFGLGVSTVTLDSGGGNITLFGESELTEGLVVNGNIVSQGGSISLEGISNLGSGLMMDGTVDSGGGDIFFTGNSTSGEGIVTIGPINSGGGNITFTGDSDLGIQLFENLISEGGSISITDSNGLVSTQDLTTTGGNILVESGSTITAGNLDSSNNSPGGNITLSAPDGIQVNSINSQGSSAGGAINVATRGSFQALGSFVDRAGITVSLSSWGGTSGGPITLTYSPETFTVGDASSNGTRRAINSRNVTLANTSFAGSRLFGGGTPGQVALISLSGTSITDPNDGNTTDEENDLPPDPLRRGPERRGRPRTALTSIERTALNNQQPLPEQKAQAQFENYFGNTLRSAREVSIGESRATLRDIQVKTGEVPAFLYVRFSQNEAVTPGEGQNSDQPTLELLLITADQDPKLVRVLNTDRQSIFKAQEQLRRQITNPNLTNHDAYLQSAQQLYNWIIAPIQSDLEAAGVTNIGFIMDSGLRTLPLAALHDGQQFLVEAYSIGLIPSVGLIDTNYVNLNRQSSSMVVAGSAEFIDQSPLWAANLEMQAIQNFWSGEAMNSRNLGLVTGTNFTVDALQKSRQQAGIIHMATHAEFLRGAPSHSYLQFFDRRLRLNEVPQLEWYAPQVELVTLSACQTAMGNLDAELGFAGFALQAGAKSALASLWKVSDEATAGLMVTFYQQLDQQTTKAETLRQTQLAMIYGEVYTRNGQLVLPGQMLPLPPQLVTDDQQTFSHPFYWAAFTMVGSPW